MDAAHDFSAPAAVQPDDRFAGMALSVEQLKEAIYRTFRASTWIRQVGTPRSIKKSHETNSAAYGFVASFTGCALCQASMDRQILWASTLQLLRTERLAAL